MMPSWCREVNWGNCGIPRVNCAVLSVKDDWKGQCWGLRYSLSKLRSFLSFSVSMTSYSKIAQFNWECIGRLSLSKLRTFLSFAVRYDVISKIAQLNWECIGRLSLSKLRSFLSFSVRYDIISKIAQFNWEFIGRLRLCEEKRSDSDGVCMYKNGEYWRR